jgi:hypothetical protein
MSRRHDKDIDNMDEEEFDEYLQEIPSQYRPKISHILILIAFGGLESWFAFRAFSAGSNPWFDILLAFASFVGAGLLLSRLLRSKL